jgi:hypothetical protein
MQRLKIILCCALLAGACGPSLADQSWLLLAPSRGQDTVVTPVGTGFRTLATVGRVVSYGESAHAFAFLSYEASLGTRVLSVVDKASGQVTGSIPIDTSVIPAGWMSGATLNLVLTDRFAYFVSWRLYPDGTGPARNEDGGVFYLNRVAVPDGKLEQYPLPEECVNPRIVDFAGVPVIHAWAGFGVWKFDEVKHSVVTLVSAADVRDITAHEGNVAGKRAGPKSAVISSYVMVPGAGAFRLSRVGELQQVLNADLTLANLPRPTLKVASSGEQPEILLGKFHGSPAIGVARVLGDHIDFKYIDPTTFVVLWDTVLPQDAFIPSIYAQIDDALVYLDRTSGAIERSSPHGTKLLWNVGHEPGSGGINVLSVGDAQ